MSSCYKCRNWGWRRLNYLCIRQIVRKIILGKMSLENSRKSSAFLACCIDAGALPRGRRKQRVGGRGRWEQDNGAEISRFGYGEGSDRDIFCEDAQFLDSVKRSGLEIDLAVTSVFRVLKPWEMNRMWNREVWRSKFSKKEGWRRMGRISQWGKPPENGAIKIKWGETKGKVINRVVAKRVKRDELPLYLAMKRPWLLTFPRAGSGM